VHQIEVVNHEIENDADIGAASAPGPQSPAIDLSRTLGEIEKTGVRKYKALLMTDREDAPDAIGKSDQFVGLIKVRRNRFFDEDVGACVQERADDLGMGRGGRAHADQIDFAQQVPPIGYRAYTLHDLKVAPDIGTDVGDGNELNVGRRRVLRSVIPTECAGADDRRLQCASPFFVHTTNQENPREFRDISPWGALSRHS